MRLHSDPLPAFLPHSARVDQHREHLFDIKWVALCRVDNASHQSGRQAGRAEQVYHDLLGGGVGQWL